MSSNITTNLTGKYDFKIAENHDFNVLVGAAWDRTKREGNGNFYQGFPDDVVLIDPNSAAISLGQNSFKSEIGINSLFSRVSYSYKDLYNLTANFRTDSSSKFGPDNKRAFFPSLSLSWNASNEDFLTEVEQINVLKFRLSGGKVGSANTADFAYLPFFEVVQGGYGNSPAVKPSNTQANLEIGWEDTKEVNFGLDFKLFSHRLSGSIDIYDRLTSRALALTPIPLELGGLNYYSNLMDVSNKGIEINLGGDLVRNENFTWNLALSDPLPEDNWTGATGFIHNVLFENYPKNHPAPEDCEFYMCGPPMMNAAVIKLLEDLGVEPENILLDDFGG